MYIVNYVNYLVDFDTFVVIFNSGKSAGNKIKTKKKSIFYKIENKNIFSKNLFKKWNKKLKKKNNSFY